MPMADVHSRRLALLVEILKTSDIVLNALRIDDIDILENALTEREKLIEEHDSLVVSVPGYTESTFYLTEEVRSLLQSIQVSFSAAQAEHAAMMSRLQQGLEATRKEAGILNRKKAVDTAYSQRLTGMNSSFFDQRK